MQSHPNTTGNISDDNERHEPDQASTTSARIETVGLLFAALMLVVLPQVLAVATLELPSALQTPLPADAEGNARVVHGGAAMILGLLLVVPTFPAVCGLLGCLFGPAGKRAETAFTSLAFCVAGLALPVVFTPAFEPEASARTMLIVWTVTSLLVLVPVQKRLLHASHTSVAVAGTQLAPLSGADG